MPNQTHESRRTFIKAVGAGSVAALAAPMILHAEDKAEAKAGVLGSGRHTYEVVPGWGTLPEGKKGYGDTHALQQTEDGRIIVHHTGADSVVFFDPDGKFMGSWGKDYPGAHGMQLRKEGNEEFLYLALTGQHIVQKTSLKGEVVMELKAPAEARDTSNKPIYKDPNRYVPTNIALAPNGDFYVSDGYGTGFVHRYNIKGEYISTFGGGGNKEGQFSCPHGITCDMRDKDNPTILVADRANVRLQWFTMDGRFIKIVKDELRHPCHFDERQGDMLIPDLRGRVTIFDKDNKLVCHLGDNPDKSLWANHGAPREKRIPGQFCNPHGAIWDKAGDIYVGEWIEGGRLTKLRHVA
jgi:hypothetical protein